MTDSIGSPRAMVDTDAMPIHGFSFWDALIWSAAVENKGAIIYSEDFQDGRDVEGVRFVNPFARGSPLPA